MFFITELSSSYYNNEDQIAHRQLQYSLPPRSQHPALQITVVLISWSPILNGWLHHFHGSSRYILLMVPSLSIHLALVVPNHWQCQVDDLL